MWALKLIQREENSASVHSSLINQILVLMEKDWDIDVKHVFPEENKCADFLASYTLQLQEVSHFLQDPPVGLKGVLHDDLVDVFLLFWLTDHYWSFVNEKNFVIFLCKKTTLNLLTLIYYIHKDI